MEKIDRNHPLSISPDFMRQNIQVIKEMFPFIVKEGKVDREELLSLFEDELEKSEEYYRFTWAGKSQARQEANKPSTGTLRPEKKESVDWEMTGNIFIEGDNLEVLKLLQKSYANRIKMIYIDPPYNTGKDFVYKDNYTDNLGNYLAITGQTDKEGKKLSTNTESDGRYHSNWLNMMYPRLKLARNLLKDNGAIFISIDDNEVHNLRKICDEVFGEENFVSNIIWHKRYAASNDAKGIPAMHDHILVYQRSSSFVRNLLPRTAKQDDLYKYDSKDGKGLWRPDNLTVKTVSESYLYEIVNPNTGKSYRPTQGRCWLTNQETMQTWIAEGRVFFGAKGEGAPQLKRYLSEVQQGVVPNSYWSYEEVGHTDSSRKELKKLFKTSAPFDNPKPTGLIKRILNISMGKDEFVMDFFAGSGSTADAVMQLNAEDGGHRKFICIQMPETTEPDSEAFKAGYKYISEVTKDRIRLAGEKIKSDTKNVFIATEEKSLDIGFRCFKLDSSNINAWDGSVGDFEQNLLSAAENIKPDRTEEDVLYEILLKSGLDLAQPIEEKKIAGKKVFNIGVGALFICLANNLTTDVAEGIGKWKQELEPATCKVIFKDTGFNDVEKTNSIQILKRYGIKEVNTI